MEPGLKYANEPDIRNKAQTPKTRTEHSVRRKCGRCGGRQAKPYQFFTLKECYCVQDEGKPLFITKKTPLIKTNTMRYLTG